MPHRAEFPRSGNPSHRRWYDPSIRIGDAERNEVTDALAQHYSAGRLDQVELDERLGRASAAKTGGDLAGIMADLPPLGATAPAPPPPARRWRAALWVAVALVLLAFAAPWRLGPWGWWFPHPPVILVVLALAVVWGRRHRHRWRSVPPA